MRPHRHGVGIDIQAVEAVEHRIETEADTVQRHDFADGIEYLEENPRAVFVASAVFVGTQVGLRREELVEEVAVGGVDLDPVKAGGLGIGGGTFEVGGHRLDVVTAQRPWRHGARLAGERKHLPFRVHRRWRHRRLAVVEFRQRQAAAVPELADDQPATGMDCIGDQAPAGNLLIRPDAGGEGVAAALWRNDGAFGNDQAGTGALGVVLGHHRRRHVAGVVAAAAGERRHDDAVLQFEGAKAHRGQEFHGQKKKWGRKPPLSCRCALASSGDTARSCRSTLPAGARWSAVRRRLPLPNGQSGCSARSGR